MVEMNVPTLIFRQLAWELAPKLAVIFRYWVRSDSFRHVGD